MSWANFSVNVQGWKNKQKISQNLKKKKKKKIIVRNSGRKAGKNSENKREIRKIRKKKTDNVQKEYCT